MNINISMKRFLMLSVIVVIFEICLSVSAEATSNGRSDYSLAYYWAPVWMQDTDSSNYRADYISRFNYDGDWKGNNNWENLRRFPQYAYIYYSVIETRTSYFIIYADFHPRDWDENCWIRDCHENDLEGVMVVVKKDSTLYGQFQLMVTVAHNDFYSYKDYHSPLSRAVRNSHEDIDGDVQFWASHHPYVYVEAKGHGVHGNDRWEYKGFPGGDGVKYYPGRRAQVPSSGRDRYVSYRLRSMNELWRRRFDYRETYARFGTFRGNTKEDNKANAPWGWDDHNDGPVYAGDFYLNPAWLVDRYHNGLGPFSHVYVYSSDGVRR